MAHHSLAASPKTSLSLVADVGGTNTRVALAQGAEIVSDTVRRFPNKDFSGLERVLMAFMDDMDLLGRSRAVASACVAVAGPVRAGEGSLTNLNWHFDKDTLAKTTGAPVTSILNDLQAQGHALSSLPDTSVHGIFTGAEPIDHGAKLVIGVGTGFNAAVVFETPQGPLVPPSEAGHANLPIRSEADLRLCRHVEKAHGFPAVEDVLSGRGLERIYAWLGEELGSGKPTDAASPPKSAAEIMAACESSSDDRAQQAIRHFCRILGVVAGNLSLIHLPFGGVYLVGGVARALQPYLSEFGFDSAFHDKGRFSSFMDNFSTHLVIDDFAALTGCAAHVQRLVQQSE